MLPTCEALSNSSSWPEALAAERLVMSEAPSSPALMALRHQGQQSMGGTVHTVLYVHCNVRTYVVYCTTQLSHLCSTVCVSYCTTQLSHLCSTVCVSYCTMQLSHLCSTVCVSNYIVLYVCQIILYCMCVILYCTVCVCIVLYCTCIYHIILHCMCIVLYYMCIVLYCMCIVLQCTVRGRKKLAYYTRT